LLKKYVVQLTDSERTHLLELINSGQAAARKLAHARILLKADSVEGWTDETIHEALDVSLATIARVRKAYVEGGLATALDRKPLRRHRPRRLDGVQEAHLIAMACSPVPAGYEHWTLRLLAEKMVTLEYVEALSPETVRTTLKKTNSSRGSRKNGVSRRKPKAILSGTWKMC
jgi:transposase